MTGCTDSHSYHPFPCTSSVVDVVNLCMYYCIRPLLLWDSVVRFSRGTHRRFIDFSSTCISYKHWIVHINYMYDKPKLAPYVHLATLLSYDSVNDSFFIKNMNVHTFISSSYPRLPECPRQVSYFTRTHPFFYTQSFINKLCRVY